MLNFTADRTNDTIVVNDITYNVEREHCRDGMSIEFTIEQFPGLVGKVANEEYIESWMSPRDSVDGLLGVMATSYRGYSFGDESHDLVDYDGGFEIPCADCNGTGESYGPDNEIGGFPVRPPDCFYCGGEGTIITDPATWARKVHGARVVLPVFVYEHSGITMSVGKAIPTAANLGPGGDFDARGRNPFDAAGWDTSAVGIIFDTTETREACGWEDRSDEEIEKDLRAEIDIYDDFLQGMVYYYTVIDEESGYDEGCGAMYGEAYTEEECFGVMAHAIAARLDEQAERADAAARDIVTV